jgi:hypothetical protein
VLVVVVPPICSGKVAEVVNVGVTSVGLVANTSVPVPVSSVIAASRLALLGVPNHVATPVPNDVIPVPPLATGRVPVTPVVSGKPVQDVSVPEVGVPRIGVTSVGLVLITTEPEPVIALLTRFLLASVNTACDAVRFGMLIIPALVIDSLEIEFV